MERVEGLIRGIASRLERLETESDRLGRELARVADGRLAEQENARRALEAVETAAGRGGEVAELRAEMDRVSTALQQVQAAARSVELHQEEADRRIESTVLRIEGVESRVGEDRKLVEDLEGVTAALRDDLRRTGDALHSVRERQAQHVAEREADLATLREAAAEPATKLARLEEARRADAAAVQNAVALAGQLASAHQQMRAAIEKLGRLISENESVVVAELTDIRTEAAAAAATVREMAEERAARQQADIALALDAARQAQETASTLHEATSRLRGRIEGAVQQLVSEEGQRLKRAADHAEAELRAHEEQRHRADGP